MNLPADSLVDQVREFIREHRLLEDEEPVVVGVSGGADSVALLTLLHELGHSTIVVHVNYGLRGEASDADEALVRDLCLRLEAPHFVHHVNLAARDSSESVQMAARRIRYDQFSRIASTHGVAKVTTAHHADDQAETVLLNLFRGAGPEGLAGMPLRRTLTPDVELVRPLLSVHRGEIESFLRQRDQEWREDASNFDDAYRRGFIRSRLLPLIREEYGAGVEARIAYSAELMRGYVETTLRPEVQRRMALCTSFRSQALTVSCLRREPAVWRRRILLEAASRWLPDASQTSALAHRLDDLVEAQAGRSVPAGGGTIWREQDVLRFVAEDRSFSNDEFILAPGQSVDTAAGKISLHPADEVTFDRADRNSEYLDLDRLELPLRVRPWRTGDRFITLGMSGSSLVSDILTDAKVPSSQRGAEYVVEDANGIIWLVGHRLADHVRIQSDSGRIAKLSFEPG